MRAVTSGKPTNWPPFLSSGARCYHCYRPTSRVKGRSGDLSESQIDAGTFLDLLRAALPLGLRAVKITGGEPLLRPDLRAIIEGVRHLGLTVSMETNAFLLDEDMADFLTAKEVDVSISLDGGSAEVHDSLRGLISYCRGSCRALAYEEIGSFAAPHPFCQTAYERGLFPSHYLRGR